MLNLTIRYGSGFVKPERGVLFPVAVSRSRVINALSPVRMRPYLDLCEGNEKKALELYRWHGELTAAVQTVLGIVEVILRNAIDTQLQIWDQSNRDGAKSWLLEEPAAPLRSLTSHKRLSALQRAKASAAYRSPHHYRYRQEITHDDVLAQVMFGMWKDLLPNHAPNAGQNLDNQNRERLWGEAIRLAFPKITDPVGKETYWRVAHLHMLRNRVSHMEPLLNLDVADYMRDAYELLGSIDPEVATWLTGVSRVSAILKQTPVEGVGRTRRKGKSL